MILEIVGFCLSSLIAGIFLLLKLTNDIFPLALKKCLTRIVVSNWIRNLPQILPIYHPMSPKSTQDAGIVAYDVEWEIEKPQKPQQKKDLDTLLIYGIDDKKNAIVIKFTRSSDNFAVADIVLKINSQLFTANITGTGNNPHEFSIGNLKLELVEPFRCWRIWYNGPMQPCNPASANLVHATLNFLWKPLEDPSDFKKNANVNLLTNYLCDKGTFGSQFSTLDSDVLPEGYNQFGSLHGMVKVDSEESELYLYGYRQRFHHKNDDGEIAKRMEFFAMRDFEGDSIRLMNFKDAWVDGITSYASLEKHFTVQVDCGAELFYKNSTFPKLFELKDKKGVQRVEIWPQRDSLMIPNSLDITFIEMEINGTKAHGILFRNVIPKTNFGIIETNKLPQNSILIHEDLDADLEFVDLASPACQKIDLVGGKGASLAKLAALNYEFNDFKTARGFCATTKLFKRVLDVEAISEILQNSSDSENLEQSCKKVMELIKLSGADAKMSPKVNTFMRTIFGESRSRKRFAVRSSGVLEDGSDLSCAGQNETFLGVDEDSVPLKIVECWASLFTTQSVTYRLNHGQPAISEMSVVIQEMVDATSAGVLFSANPRTGNPFEMLITANYGLGESVVSASCDPDTIEIMRPRNILRNNNPDDILGVTISSKTIGSKKTKVVISQNGKSTEEQKLSQTDSSKLCISDEKVLQLGAIGVQIEKSLGQQKPVDIEWAISNDEIFILQCRAMTSLDAWTDFEINCQFDSGLRTQNEQLTTANTGEVMPKPLHAISAQTVARILDFGIQKGQQDLLGQIMSPIVFRSIGCHRQRCFLNTFYTLYKTVEAEITPALACLDLSIFGRPVITEETHKIAVQRYGIDTGLGKIKGLLKAIQIVRGCQSEVDQANNKHGNWNFTLHGEKTVQNVYDQITADLLILKEIIISHCRTSQASGTAQMFVFLAITGNKKAEDWPPSLYEDAGKLLAAYAEVESADMPKHIDALGEKVIKSGKGTELLNSKSTNEAIILLNSDKELENSLKDFLLKHGHRSVAELDIGQISWEENPTPFIQLLKSIVKNKLKVQVDNLPTSSNSSKFAFTSDENLVNSLKTPLKNGTKKFLKFLLPHHRRTVSGRERTKSITVRVIDQIRKAYNLLAEMMVKEQLLPEKGLIRHLAHHEIKLLIKRDPSSASILYRATRRQRLYPSLLEDNYPEISRGLPIPIDKSLAIETTNVLKGTPVSSGKIKGIAKVCLSVEEAANLLEHGDILITSATDIAWSPFFPILGGVVTELGGLISHGAVVAREYGLPCIVGAINATKIFNTGDIVILDTGTGTLSKVKA